MRNKSNRLITTVTSAYLLFFLTFHLAFQEEDTGSFQFDAITIQPKNHLSAASRCLGSAKFSLAEPLGPIRCEHSNFSNFC